MARLAKILNSEKKDKLIAKYAVKRKNLRAIINSLETDLDEKREAQKKLGKLPRRSCKTQKRNRCKITGRANGVYRVVGLARAKFREMVMEGLIPGMRKASW